MALAESYYDPLNEFASEAPPQPVSERVSHRAPQAVTLGEPSYEPSYAAASPPLFTVAYEPYAHSPAARAPQHHWAAAAVMLCIGLAAGFAGAMAILTRYGDPHLWLPKGDVVRTQSTAPTAQTQQTRDLSKSIDVRAIALAPPAPVKADRGSLESRLMIPPGAVAVVYVQSRPTGADVYLDDQLITTTPFQLSDITLGPHTIRVEMPGYRPWIESIDVQVGSRISIAAALEQ